MQLKSNILLLERNVFNIWMKSIDAAKINVRAGSRVILFFLNYL